MGKRAIRLVSALLAVAGTAFLSGCSAMSGDSGAGYDSRQYYDLYMDRPGYYDFGRPVILPPDER